jgi:hypothetical protein
MWSLELKALGQLEAARRSRTKRHRASLKTSAAPRRCCATAIRMVASRRPLQRSRLQSVLRSSSLSALQQVAGHCPRSAESLLRDGHYNGRVSAAVTTVAPTISLLTWVKCPASMLRDGHYNGRVSAAVTRSRICSLAFALWVSAARHRSFQLKEHVRACLPLVPKVRSTTKAGKCAAL